MIAASPSPRALDLKVFVPTKDHACSIAFYEALGWRVNWRMDGLAEIELAGVRLHLQDFYAREWAENFMIYIDVDDARGWYDRALEIVDSGHFDGTRAEPPRPQSHGDLVTYVWDPCGILLHFGQKVPTANRPNTAGVTGLPEGPAEPPRERKHGDTG